MTTPDRWARVKQLFEAALECPPGERDALLAEECSSDLDLRREVEALLAADEETNEFLQEPAAELLGLGPDPVAEIEGLRIGPYRVLREIGRGGMGVVYEAERADLQYRKRVAIKLIRRGMDSDLIHRRFRQERQILAGLNHPNIAGLLDGGMTGDGHPYLVMEFVHGLPIHTYVSKHQLPLHERIRLFREVCAAVHFAHQNLVVHRDLKPSNILVTEAGDVKLLDFGVAKMLRPDLELTVPVTEAGARVFTPTYASPEQVRGEPVTTATDVYSLGVVLYELLTGRPPFDFAETSFQQVERMVCDAIPTRPSAAVGLDTTRPTDSPEARALRRMLAGELDNIVLMAMRKEPARRYASAAALDEDLGRYLDGLPVVALKDTAIYRLRKLVQRQRGLAIAGGIGFVVLCGGLGATLWQAGNANRARRIAEQRFVDVHSLTKTLLFDVYDALAEVPGATRTRELVVRRAFEYLDRLADQGQDNGPLLRDVAEAYIRLGLVEGQPSGPNRGMLTDAKAAFTRATAIAQELVTRDSSNPGFQRTLALAHEKLGDVEAWEGRVDSGVAHARLALAGFSAIASAQPDSVRAQLSAVISTVKLADLLGNPSFPNLGDAASALHYYEVARTRLESPPLAGQTDAGTRRYVGLVQERLGSLFRLSGQWADALQAFARSLSIREALAESERGVNSTRDVAVTRQNLCEIQVETREFQAAASNCRRSHELFEELWTADPHNLQSADDLARSHASGARLNASVGNWAGAARELAQTVALRDSILVAHPENVRNHQLLGAALLDLVPYYVAIVRAGGPGAAVAARQGRAALQRAELMLQVLAAKGLATDAERARLRESARSLSILASR